VSRSGRWYTSAVIILVAAVSALLYGVSDYAGGRSARRLSPITVALIGDVLLAIAYGIAVAIDRPPLDGPTVWWGMIAGLGSMVGVVAFFAALRSGAMTVASPITGVVSAVLPVLVGLALGERPGMIAGAGVVLAVGAVALVGGAIGVPHAAVSRRQVALALLAGAAFGLWFIGLERAGDDSGLWPLVTSRILTLPTLMLWERQLRRRSDHPRMRRSSLWWAVTSGAFILAANIAYLGAVRDGLLSVVAVVVSLYPASTVALAIVIDRERVARTQIIGMGLAGVALVLVGVA